jgi:hypothetical protein
LNVNNIRIKILINFSLRSQTINITRHLQKRTEKEKDKEAVLFLKVQANKLIQGQEQARNLL